MYCVLCMKKVYLGDGETGLICENPFIGVFSTYIKAENAVTKHINQLKETVVSDYLIIHTDINKYFVDEVKEKVKVEVKETVYNSCLY